MHRFALATYYHPHPQEVALAGGSETASARIESLQQQLQVLQAEHNQRLQVVKEEAESAAGKQETILEQQREELATQKSELEAAYAYQQELAAAHAAATEAKTAALQEVSKQSQTQNAFMKLCEQKKKRRVYEVLFLGAYMNLL